MNQVFIKNIEADIFNGELEVIINDIVVDTYVLKFDDIEIDDWHEFMYHDLVYDINVHNNTDNREMKVILYEVLYNEQDDTWYTKTSDYQIIPVRD